MNLSNSNNKIIAALAKWMSRTDNGRASKRFNKKSFSELFQNYPGHQKEVIEIKGEREMIVVITK